MATTASCECQNESKLTVDFADTSTAKIEYLSIKDYSRITTARDNGGRSVTCLLSYQ